MLDPADEETQPDEPVYARACAIADFPPGASMMLAVGDYDIALFNAGGEFFAIDDVCPHFAGSLHEGTVTDENVSCPLHGWCFNLRNGAQTNGRRSVLTFETRVEGGDLLVCGTPRA
jgi:nitrite reductase/ring-hydroxylating ferredoxin subunit